MYLLSGGYTKYINNSYNSILKTPPLYLYMCIYVCTCVHAHVFLDKVARICTSFHMVNYQGNTNKNFKEISLTSITITTIKYQKKAAGNICCQGCGAKDILVYYINAFFKIVIFKGLLHSSAVPVLGVYPKKLK